MGNPSKPSTVKVEQLKQVLSHLQRLQEDVNNPPPASFDAIGVSIENDLKQGDKGMQRNGAQVAGNRYEDGVHFINQAWSDVRGGIATLVGYLQATISQHSGTDTEVANTARQTNTTQQAGAAKGKD